MKLIDYNTLSREVTLVNSLGLHARPAAVIAKIAQKAESGIWISSGNDRVDAASIIEILSMGGTKGTAFVLEAESEVDLPLLDAIAEAFLNGFGEEIDG